MKINQILVILFAFLTLTLEIDGQQLKENEVVVIKGEKYVLHQVRTGETIYSLSKQFMVDSITIVHHNPHIIESGLKIGEILKIPFREEADLKNLPIFKKGDPAYFDYYTISSRRETPYFVAKEHGITVEEIFAYNPEVTRFKKGVQIRIPRWGGTPEKEKEADKEEDIKKVTETVDIPVDKMPSKPKEKELIRYTVKSGETLYSISRKYNIPQSEILFYNPEAKNLKAGSIIYIPQYKETEEEILVTDQPEAHPDQIAGKDSAKYFDYIIVSGETLWRISKRFGVSEEELIELNPELKEGFTAGTVIKVPVKESSLVNAEPVNEDAFEKHVVQQGETLYSLANFYNVTIPDIKKYNPFLESRNLVAGETVLIPKTHEKEIVTFNEELLPDTITDIVPVFEKEYYEIVYHDKIPESCLPNNFRDNPEKVYNLALFLPFFLEDNDYLNQYSESPDSNENNLLENPDIINQDTLIEHDYTPHYYEFYEESENYLRFYEGVLLAIDSMQSLGMKIRLNVFDTRMKLEYLRNQINRINFLETDLIIGPVYPQVQKEIAALAAKNRVPIISPLSSVSDELKSNTYFFQVNPTRDFLEIRTAELIAEEYFNSNFIVFKIGKKSDETGRNIPEMVKERLLHSGFPGQTEGFKLNFYDFDREGTEGLRRILSGDKENVIFISSLDEGNLSVALSNINNLADQYDITLIGHNRYQQFRSINIEFFHNLKLHYIAPYWVDYSDKSTISFFQKFRDYFHTEPENFGIQGYDVTLYFLTALKNYGKDFRECIPYMNTNLIQGNYNFEQVSRFGGFMNTGVSVISYKRDYEVVRKRFMGQNNIVQR